MFVLSELATRPHSQEPSVLASKLRRVRAISWAQDAPSGSSRRRSGTEATATDVQRAVFAFSIFGTSFLRQPVWTRESTFVCLG